MSFEVRKMLKKDFDEVANLASQAMDIHHKLLPNFFKSDFTNEKRVERYSKLFDDEKYLMLVSEKDNNIMGYLIAEFRDAPWYIRQHICTLEEITVDETFRSKGIGTALVEALRAECSLRGTQSISLNVYLANSKAIKLYQRLGFNEVSYKMIMDI